MLAWRLPAFAAEYKAELCHGPVHAKPEKGIKEEGASGSMQSAGDLLMRWLHVTSKPWVV